MSPYEALLQLRALQPATTAFIIMTVTQKQCPISQEGGDHHFSSLRLGGVLLLGVVAQERKFKSEWMHAIPHTLTMSESRSLSENSPSNLAPGLMHSEKDLHSLGGETTLL